MNLKTGKMPHASADRNLPVHITKEYDIGVLKPGPAWAAFYSS